MPKPTGAARCLGAAWTTGFGADTGAACGCGAAVFTLLNAGSAGAGDCCCEPPSPNTWSWLAVPPPDDVGVPPTVIATYSLPPTE